MTPHSSGTGCSSHHQSPAPESPDSESCHPQIHLLCDLKTWISFFGPKIQQTRVPIHIRPAIVCIEFTVVWMVGEWHRKKKTIDIIIRKTEGRQEGSFGQDILYAAFVDRLVWLCENEGCSEDIKKALKLQFKGKRFWCVLENMNTIYTHSPSFVWHFLSAFIRESLIMCVYWVHISLNLMLVW